MMVDARIRSTADVITASPSRLRLVGAATSKAPRSKTGSFAGHDANSRSDCAQSITESAGQPHVYLSPRRMCQSLHPPDRRPSPSPGAIPERLKALMDWPAGSAPGGAHTAPPRRAKDCTTHAMPSLVRATSSGRTSISGAPSLRPAISEHVPQAPPNPSTATGTATHIDRYRIAPPISPPHPPAFGTR